MGVMILCGAPPRAEDEERCKMIDWMNLYKGEKNLIVELKDWLRIVFTCGLWAFLPALAGIGLAYALHYNGVTPQKVKHYNEILAVSVLMPSAVLVFLVRVIKYRTMFDWVFFILAVAFLCREIHFYGTGTGVYVVAVFCGVLAWWQRDRILEELSGKNQLKAAIFCMCWTYLLALLIQRRVFKAGRIPLLPDEAAAHITIEEVIENFAHASFILVGLLAFAYGRRMCVGARGTESSSN